MAQEHQEYIQQKVNPILENLVTQLLMERPDQLAPFLIKWLSEHQKTPLATAVTDQASELSALKAELAKLQEEVKQLEDEVGDKTCKADRDDESEEEEEDDEVCELEDMKPPTSYLKKERTSVSAEAYGKWNKRNSNFTPPVIPKTPEQTQRIKSVLNQSFLFNTLETKDLDLVIGAMCEQTCESGTRIIEQGDDGDCLFVVEEGQMDCYKKTADGEDTKVKECKPGDAFGELALMYNTPRAASVIAAKKCVLWKLDRETFNHIVKDAATKRRLQHEEFLKSVPILDTMESYERNQMCDALQTVSYKKGATIVKQGDPGDKFFILEEGECIAEKIYVEGSAPTKVMDYKSSDYFGELALLTNEPRAASIIAKTDCKLLTLQRRVFKDLLGPLEEILKRNASSYA